MADTAIEWADKTWNPTVGCMKVSAGCELPRVQVMTADVLAGPSLTIKTREHLTASTGARNHGVAFAWMAQGVDAMLTLARPVFRAVLPARDDLKIPGAIIRFITVQVVNNLAPVQRAAEHFRRNQSVFVNVSANVRQRVAWKSEQHVAMLCDGATAAPNGVGCSSCEQGLGHNFRVTRWL